MKNKYFNKKLFLSLFCFTVVGGGALILPIASCSKGSDAIRLKIQQSYNVQVGTLIEIPVICKHTLSTSDFEFIHSSPLWNVNYDNKKKIITIFSANPNDKYGESFYIISNVFYLKWKTTIHFYDFNHFVFNGNLKTIPDSSVLGECQDYNTDLPTTPPQIVAQQSSYSINNLDFSFYSFQIVPKILSLSHWWARYKNQWKTLSTLRSYFSGIDPLEFRLNGSSIDSYNPFSVQKQLNWSPTSGANVVNQGSGIQFNGLYSPFTSSPNTAYYFAYLFDNVDNYELYSNKDNYIHTTDTRAFLDTSSTTCSSPLSIDYGFIKKNVDNWEKPCPFDVYAYSSTFSNFMPFITKNADSSKKLTFIEQSSANKVMKEFYSTGIKFEWRDTDSIFSVPSANIVISYLDPAVSDPFSQNIEAKINFIDNGIQKGYFFTLRFLKSIVVKLVDANDHDIVFNSKVVDSNLEINSFNEYSYS